MQQPLPLFPAHPTHWRGTCVRMANPCHLLGWAHVTFSRSLTRYVHHFYRFALFMFPSHSSPALLYPLHAVSMRSLLGIVALKCVRSLRRRWGRGRLYCIRIVLEKYRSRLSVRPGDMTSCLRRRAVPKSKFKFANFFASLRSTTHIYLLLLYIYLQSTLKVPILSTDSL